MLYLLVNILVGVFFLGLGVCFLVLPMEKLQKAFPKMRSKTVTKVGGGVLVICGLIIAAVQIMSQSLK